MDASRWKDDEKSQRVVNFLGNLRDKEELVGSVVFRGL